MDKGNSPIFGQFVRSVVNIGRPRLFLLSLATFYILPILLGLEISYTFTFAILLTLGIWLSVKWTDFVNLESRGNYYEILIGIVLMGVNFGRNMIVGGMFGLTDMLITFITLYVVFFGARSTRFFLPPSIYMMILIGGYQIEFFFPQIKALEVWLADIMANIMVTVGAEINTVGNTVAIYGDEIYALRIDGPCTGIKGITAYGALAAMLVIDAKSTVNRRMLAVAIGFVGTFLINIGRLAAIFLSSYFISVEAALLIHTYLGYTLFITWVIIFWSLAFRYILTKSDTPPIESSVSSKYLGK